MAPNLKIMLAGLQRGGVMGVTFTVTPPCWRVSPRVRGMYDLGSHWTPIASTPTTSVPGRVSKMEATCRGGRTHLPLSRALWRHARIDTAIGFPLGKKRICGIMPRRRP